MANYTSKYVQLTEYCLLEYRYTDLLNPERYSFNFTKVINNHPGAAYNQILNVDAADDTTRNVQERSVAKISPGKYADLNKDLTPPYLQYDPLFTNSTISTSTANLPYDTVLFHFLSGYNFEDLDGVIFEIAAAERSGKNLMLADIAFLKNSEFFEFNPRPIFLGDRFYDRYIQVKIPALKLVNDIFYSLEGNPTQPLTFVAQITSDGRGFLRATPITISAIEIKSTDTLNTISATYDIYNIGATKIVSINQTDEFSLLSAVINKSTVGDYFEYYASFDGGFIEDFIFNSNAQPGNNYIVLHELRVLEQIGSIFKQTSYFQSIQDSDYNSPQLFRPVIINANKAVSFTIEYTMRLYNKADSSQIIRIASYTDFNPKSFGGQLDKIKLLTEPDPHKIYNKIVNGPTVSQSAFIQTASQVNPYTTKFVPAFFDRSIISINKDTVQLDSDGKLTVTKSSTTQPVFGQGSANIIVTPFDNYYKFTILKTEAQNNGIPTPLDLGQNAAYYMVFIDDNGNKNRFGALTDAIIGDNSKGDLVFKISGDDSEKILKFANKQFWIISSFADGSETNIYQGLFNDVTQRATATANEQAAQDASSSNTSLKSVLSIPVTVETASASRPVTSVRGGDQPVTISGVTIPSGTTQSTVAHINAQIPGLAVDLPSSKTSIVASIKPRSLDITATQTAQTQTDLSGQTTSI